MSRRALVLGLCLLGLGALVFTFAGGGAPPEAPATMAEPDPVRSSEDGVSRVAFLKGVDLDAREDYALILHPMATGQRMRVVTDQTALRAAQDRAFYTDDPGEELKMLAMSILFMSPPGMPPDSQFATLLRGKDVVEHFRCYPAFCNRQTDAQPPHTRDLAGLLEASRPVERVTETSLNPDEIRARHYRALQDPEVVQIDPPDLPPPNRVIYPERRILLLPAILLEADEAGYDPAEPFDEAEYTDRFTVAFEHAYPETEAYRLGEMRFIKYYPPQYGWPVVSDEFKGYLRDESGDTRGIGGLILLEPSIAIDVSSPMAEVLDAPGAFNAMPAFAREPVNLSDRLDALAEEVLGRPCPDCFKVELPVTTVDAIKTRRVNPTEYSLTYLKVAE